jgi:predicted nucleotide-binding protein
MFHVHATTGVLGLRQGTELNLEREQLVTRVTARWRAGQNITLEGKAFAPARSRLSVYEGPRVTSSQQSFGQGWLNAVKFGEDVTEDVLREAVEERQADGEHRNVFVVHGRDTRLRDDVFVFLLALKLKPMEWPNLLAESKDGSPYVGDVVGQLREAAAVLVLFTPDDVAMLRSEYVDDADPQYERELTGQARQNVTFEAGMALGLVPEKTILVGLGETRPFSDILGRWILRLTDQPASRIALAERLRAIGCDVETGGELWLNQGQFSLPHDGGQAAQPKLSRQHIRKIANVLAGELEEAVDLIGRALEADALWAAPRRMPTNAANAHLDELAAEHSDVHKAVRDAYRKINDLNWQQIARAAAEQPGVMLSPGESLALTEEDREALAEVRSVIANALDALRRAA